MRPLLLPIGCLLALLLSSAGPANAQVCTGQAYFKPLEHQGLELGHYTSTPSQDLLGEYHQTNCVVLVNDGDGARSGVSGSFAFITSGGVPYTVSTAQPEALEGSVPTTCSTRPAAVNGPQVFAIVEPSIGTLPAGAFTDACCFVHEARPPVDECESIPGPGDTFFAEVEADGGLPDTVTGTIPTMPQGPACGMVGLELCIVAGPWLSRRRRAIARAGLRSAAGGALAAAVSLAGAPAQAAIFAVDPLTTSVELSLTAYTHQTKTASLGQGLEVEVTLEGGVPTEISFVGAEVLIADITLTASAPGGTTVSVTLDDVTARVEAFDLPIAPSGEFDASGSHVALESGELIGGGTVFAIGTAPSVDFGTFPIVLVNEATQPGMVVATPAPGSGHHVTVTLPIELAAPLSTDSGAVWLLVEDGTLGLAGTLPLEIPVLDHRGWLLLAVSLAGLGALAIRRLERSPR